MKEVGKYIYYAGNMWREEGWGGDFGHFKSLFFFFGFFLSSFSLHDGTKRKGRLEVVSNPLLEVISKSSPIGSTCREQDYAIHKLFKK